MTYITLEGGYMYNYNLNDRDGNRAVSLYSPEEGYMKGNLFPELYDQYKNYQPVMLRAKDEQSRLLLELSAVSFASHELNLYLDLHPNDESVLMLFNDYRRKANSLIDEYETKYGPITVNSDSLNASPFLWEVDAWPFEGGNR